eukprot:g7246.t1
MHALVPSDIPGLDLLSPADYSLPPTPAPSPRAQEQASRDVSTRAAILAALEPQPPSVSSLSRGSRNLPQAPPPRQDSNEFGPTYPNLTSSRKRVLRQQKQTTRERLTTWKKYMKENQSLIPQMLLEKMVRPYRKLAQEHVLLFWELPTQQQHAYILPAIIEEQYSTSFRVFSPQSRFSFLPTALASRLVQPSTIDDFFAFDHSYLGELNITNSLTLNCRLGQSSLLITFHATPQVDTVVLGTEAADAFGLKYCPVLNTLTTTSGEYIECVQVHVAPPAQP